MMASVNLQQLVPYEPHTYATATDRNTSDMMNIHRSSTNRYHENRALTPTTTRTNDDVMSIQVPPLRAWMFVVDCEKSAQIEDQDRLETK